MSVKVVKVTDQIGTANSAGVSFTITMLFGMMQRLHKNAHKRASDMGITTGPAKVYITVEQEVLVNDED